ncbi:hypothetical protein ACFQV8_26770 [Pseudonocardia benzenivorans]
MPAPRLLLLDEPATGLDLAAREQLLTALDVLRHEHPALATVLVTHHLEELPPSTTHAYLLRDGRCLAAGPASSVLTTDLVSECFDTRYRSSRRTADGRRGPAGWHPVSGGRRNTGGAAGVDPCVTTRMRVRAPSCAAAVGWVPAAGTCRWPTCAARSSCSTPGPSAASTASTSSTSCGRWRSAGPTCS